MISVILDRNIRYPSSEEFYSPDEKFPEYPFNHLARKPNPVYRAVRELLRQAGLDATAYGNPEWNPLGEWISKGQTVFVLCNFVFHRRATESIAQFESKCTHGSVVRVVIDYILKAVGSAGRIRFGNAPLQSCYWSSVLKETGAAKMETFYRKVNAPVQSTDLRLFVQSRSILPSKWEMRSEEMSVSIDLAHDSRLAALDTEDPHYRVLDYNPDRTEAFHRNGHHQYVLHRHILESDVIVSIPKLKTHEKVGITCALKGCVGAIGQKDCLAHHRKGIPEQGGDEFRNDPLGLLQPLSLFDEYVQKRAIGTWQRTSLRFVLRILRRLLRPFAPTMGGAWPGNDTCWRMSLDVARLIEQVRSDGTLASESVRPHLAFVDGIVGGEGDGPLNPTPLHTGALLFASDPVNCDDCAARLMGQDPMRLPIIREAVRLSHFSPVTMGSCCGDCDGQDAASDAGQRQVILNGTEVPLEHVHTFAKRPFRLPRGWR
jgi:uncharacterized protein (DUF362 family)